MFRFFVIALCVFQLGCTSLSVKLADGTEIKYVAAFRDIRDLEAQIGSATLRVGDTVVSEKLPEIPGGLIGLPP